MKRFTILSLLFLMAVSFNSQAQTGEYAASLLKMQQLNGSAGTYDIIFKQLKAMKPNVSDSAWAAVKKDVYDVQIVKLNEQLVPVYQKYFTLEDIKALIA
jgi:hypothetical protein